jgi:cell division protein FtsL
MRATLKPVAIARSRRSSRVLAELSTTSGVIILLVVFNLISAFALVYAKDLSRRAFIQYQGLVQTHSTQNNTWSKLLLEQSTWAAQSRIQHIATTRLGMVSPMAKNTVIVDEDSSGE